MWITIETSFNSTRPLFLVLKIVKTVAAVAVVAELAVGKTFTVTAQLAHTQHVHR